MREASELIKNEDKMFILFKLATSFRNMSFFCHFFLNQPFSWYNQNSTQEHVTSSG